MNKVQKLIKDIGESTKMFSVGHMDITKISDALTERLIAFGYPSVFVDSIIDFEGDGIFVKFEDNEGDSVVVQFHIDDEGPKATVVSDDDELIEIDLGPLNPIITK